MTLTNSKRKRSKIIKQSAWSFYVIANNVSLKKLALLFVKNERERKNLKLKIKNH